MQVLRTFLMQYFETTTKIDSQKKLWTMNFGQMKLCDTITKLLFECKPASILRTHFLITIVLSISFKKLRSDLPVHKRVSKKI